jgi:ComF family protein
MVAGVLRTIRDGLLSLAYPSDCHVCGAQVQSWDDGTVCESCWTDPAITSFFIDSVCDKCGVPNPSRAQGASGDGEAEEICRMCRLWPFAAARACGTYDGALEASVLFLKSRPGVCPRLRRIICETYERHERVLAADALVPVPLHPHRLRDRGFNQAELIASYLRRKFGLPLERDALVRTRYTERHRAGMDAIDRSRSVDRAFAVKNAAAVQGRSVLLVDDLFTTGSTVSAASRALLAAGASQVTVLTIARALDSSRR